jgi:hypothetical protein
VAVADDERLDDGAVVVCEHGSERAVGGHRLALVLRPAVPTKKGSTSAISPRCAPVTVRSGSLIAVHARVALVGQRDHERVAPASIT